MKAVAFDRFGPPDQVLSCRDLPEPTPARGEVKVRMLASPINPSDLLYIEGNYGLKPRAFPATPGFEGVGVVVENGGGLIGRLRVGKRVAVLNDRVGNWSEFTVASSKQVIPIPDSIPDDQAASFFVNPATAIALTERVLQVPAGEYLLQSAAGSALGKMIVAFAKRRGFRTINVVRRGEQADELKKLGADEVIVERDGIESQVRRITNGAGVKYAIDPVGGSAGTQVIQSLGDGGTCLLYGLLSGEPVSVDPRLLITGSKTVRGFWLSDYMKTLGLFEKLALIRQIRALMASGVFRTETAATFSLDRIGAAARAAAAPGKSGKVLLRIAPEK